jgi:hypothetical protein
MLSQFVTKITKTKPGDPKGWWMGIEGWEL